MGREISGSGTRTEKAAPAERQPVFQAALNTSSPDTSLPPSPGPRLLERVRRSALAAAIARTATANVLISVLGGAGGLLLARGLGPTVRGQLVIVTTWPTFVGLIAAWGLPQATCFLVSKRPNERATIVSTGVAMSLVIGSIIAVAGWVLAPLISGDGGVITGLRVVFVLLPVYLMPGIWQAALQALDNRAWNRSRMVQPLFYFPAVFVLYISGRLTLLTGTAVFATSIALQALITGWMALRVAPLLGRPSISLLRPLVSYGSRSVAADAPWIVNARLDQVLLSLVVPASALGSYAAAVSLSLLASPISTAFGYVAFPRIAGSLDEEAARRTERLAVLGSVSAAVAVLAPMAVGAHWLIPRIFGPSFSPAVVPFLILAPAAVIFVTNRVMGDLLRGHGHPGIPAIAEWVSAVATVALLAALVPSMGIVGAAIASLSAYSVSAVVLATGLVRRSRRAGVKDSPSINREVAGLPQVGSR